MLDISYLWNNTVWQTMKLSYKWVGNYVSYAVNACICSMYTYIGKFIYRDIYNCIMKMTSKGYNNVQSFFSNIVTFYGSVLFLQ